MVNPAKVINFTTKLNYKECVYILIHNSYDNSNSNSNGNNYFFNDNLLTITTKTKSDY